MKSIITVESVLASRSKVRVLRELRGVNVPLSTSEIARRASMSQPAAAAALRELADYGMVNTSGAGRALVHTLARENVYVQRMVEPALAAEEQIPEEFFDYLRERLGNLTESIVIFGSYARGEHGETSDVDLVLVAKGATESEKLDDAVLNCARDARRLFGMSLSAIAYTPSDAGELRNRAPALYSEIERDGVVVSGRAPWQWGDSDGA